MQNKIQLPENANRPLRPGEHYEPILKPQNSYPEITPYSVIMGVVMAVIFSAAAAYLGLKVGQVFEAAIPIAIGASAPPEATVPATPRSAETMPIYEPDESG